MSWLILVLSGLCEAVWATALGRFNGWQPGPIITFAIGVTASMGGLGWAMRDLPTGTAYAVWVGIGAVATVAYAMATGAETASLAKILLMLGIVACVIGLKVVS